MAPGGSIGTLTLGSSLTLGGNIRIELNKSLAQSNDFVAVTGLLTNSGAGIVTVTNLGPALTAGDSFKLFSQPVLNGAALTIASAPGVVWTTIWPWTAALPSSRCR